MLRSVVSAARAGVNSVLTALDSESTKRWRENGGARGAAESAGKLEAELADLRTEYTKLAGAAQAMVNERDRWERKAQEYYRIIEGILGERDQWKKMWFDDSAGHLEAQSMLDHALEAGRKLLLAMLQRLNALRTEHGLPPLGLDLKEVAAASQIVEQTKARIAKQTADAPPDVDWAGTAKFAKEGELSVDSVAIKDGEPGPVGLKDGEPGPVGLKDSVNPVLDAPDPK